MPTIRQQITDLLSQGEYDIRDLSQILGIQEKEIYLHLPHVAKSVASQKKKLRIRASACLACGYKFKDRKRFTKPGRCPGCKSERIQPPTYQIL